MSILIGFLTAVLVLDCLILILLVLIQLPKKEAGAGLAFGGAATDALFGAGSGTALTKITKYSTGIFFALSLLLSVLTTHASKSSSSALAREVEKQQQELQQKAQGNTPGAAAPSTATPAGSNTTAAGATNIPLLQVAPSSNAPANPPPGPGK
jgi:protein translocase SecG subunit